MELDLVVGRTDTHVADPGGVFDFRFRLTAQYNHTSWHLEAEKGAELLHEIPREFYVTGRVAC